MSNQPINLSYKGPVSHLTTKKRRRQRAAPARERPPKMRPAMGITASIFTWESAYNSLSSQDSFLGGPGWPSPRQWRPLRQTREPGGKLRAAWQRTPQCWGSVAAGGLSEVASEPDQESVCTVMLSPYQQICKCSLQNLKWMETWIGIEVSICRVMLEACLERYTHLLDTIDSLC